MSSEQQLFCSVEGYEEEQDLVVLQGTAKPHQSHQEEEAAHADDHGHHPDAGDQAEPFPPGCHTDQEQTHQLEREADEMHRVRLSEDWKGAW